MYSGLRGIPCWETKFSPQLVRVLFVPKWGDHNVDATKGGASRGALEPPWPVLEFLPPGAFVVSSLFWRPEAPLGRIFQRGSHVSSLDPSGEIQAYPSFYKINFQDFHCLFNLTWYQMGRGREESFNSWKWFSAHVKISPCSQFKKFKTKLY